MLKRVVIIAALALAGAALFALAPVRAFALAMDATTRSLLCAFLAALAIGYVFRPRLMSAERAGSFRGARPVQDVPDTTLDDVAACDEAKSAIRELCDYLRHAERYARYGARMPRGILLYGPPGTGKTLLARACAGEAGVPFFAMSGADFVQMYVGVGASRVRELFKKARACRRSVVFIDEIDAIGARRHEGGTDERDQTINALLTEMSGFKPSDGVIVIAATNRLDVLDPALTRPGRFDRRIEVGLPNCEQRRQILALHAKGKPLAPDVSLGALALDTAALSGAALENLLNEAAIRAARNDLGAITRADIDAAFLSVTVGGERAQRLDARERRQTAAHEAGHALLTRLLEPDSRLKRLSILPTGGALNAAGYSMSVPRERTLFTRRELNNRLSIMLAGRAAEQLMFGAQEVSSGAANDITRATELAAQMKLELGMRDCPISLRALGMSDEAGITALLRERYEFALNVLRANIEHLEMLAEALMREEVLDEQRLAELLRYDEAAPAHAECGSECSDGALGAIG